MDSNTGKITLSVMTADVGGFIGHVSSHPDVLNTAKERLYSSREKGVIEDFHVLRCGDDIGLIITHTRGVGARAIHELSWNIFTACRDRAAALKLHGVERGLLNQSFKGSLVCMGPGVAEMEFLERTSEPVVVLMCNKTGVGAWNLPVYKIFADPFNTSGLVLDGDMIEGFSFKVLDLVKNRDIILSSPKELHYLLALIGSTERYVISEVYRNSDVEPAAVVSSQKFSMEAGEASQMTEPAVVLRCQTGFPTVGEAMEAFSFPHMVDGWMRGAHTGPLMPVPFYEANPTRFDGPPRVIAAGFQLANGRLIGPHDMFDDPSFDDARRRASDITGYTRRHGPFRPHRSVKSAAENASISIVLEKLGDRFRKIG